MDPLLQAIQSVSDMPENWNRLDDDAGNPGDMPIRTKMMGIDLHFNIKGFLIATPEQHPLQSRSDLVLGVLTPNDDQTTAAFTSLLEACTANPPPEKFAQFIAVPGAPQP